MILHMWKEKLIHRCHDGREIPVMDHCVSSGVAGVDGSGASKKEGERWFECQK